MKILYFISLGLILLICACKQPASSESSKNGDDSTKRIEYTDLKKIKILNFGTFHMGFTNDATKVDFNESDRENQKKIHEIAKKLALFKPTVILVESLPNYDQQLQTEYKQYLENPIIRFKSPDEIQLLAYEVGRLSGTKRIAGIDHKLQYNYLIGSQIKNTIDSIWYSKYFKNPLKYYPEVNVNFDSITLFDKLKITNSDKYLDFLMTVNADMLTCAGTENGFEGADEAAKFYQRNLRMFSNLNRILLSTDDRVFILMGAAHTAFFRDFIRRSPKYEMVNTFEYLN